MFYRKVVTGKRNDMSRKSSIFMFLMRSNHYIIIPLELWYERCKITQNIGGAEGISEIAEDHRPGKGIFYERIVDQTRSVWIWTQVTSKGC
jgi:hypothetical protein